MLLKHRHFLALPVFLLLLGATVMTAGSEQRAQAIQEITGVGHIQAVGADRSFSLQRGISGLLREDGILTDDGEELILEDGTLLVTSDALTSVRINDVLLSAFHGGFLVTRNGTKFSVHALTSPILLRHGAFRTIVPEGMQTAWADAVDLPMDPDLQQIADERQRMQMIPEAIRADALRDLATVPPALLPALPSLTTETSALPLEALRSALASGDPKAALTLLRDVRVQELLSSTDLSGDVLPILLATAQEIPSAQQELLQNLHDVDLWILLSFHSQYHQATWENSGPLGMPINARMLRWLLLPSSDVEESIPARAVDHWAEQILRSVQTMEAPEAFLNALLGSLKGHRTFLEQSGYPERLRRSAGALQSIIEPFQANLSDDAKALYLEWKDVDAISPYVEPPAPVVMEEPAPDSVPATTEEESGPELFDIAAVEAAAKQLLLGAGALFTIETELHAESSARVLVSNLLYASSDGEHRYDFTFDPVQKQILNLRRDGNLLPYPLSLKGFGAWAAGASMQE